MSDTPQPIKRVSIGTDGTVTESESPWTAEEWAKLDAREQHWIDNGWIKERMKAYPSIGDQLDALYHAGVFPQEMADQIAAVKAAHPKPSDA